MDEKNKNRIFILFSAIILISILFVVEQYFKLPYVAVTLIKVATFITLPIFFAKYFKHGSLGFLPSFRSLKRGDAVKVACFGLAIFIAVLGTYFVLSSRIDLSTIKDELIAIGVTPLNFVFVAIYITFINSFIEEYFFRGYIFTSLLKAGWTKRAYIVSSLLFAIYHIGIFLSWFSIDIVLIVLLGLFLGGMIFDWLNSKAGNITNSWLVHMAADISVMVIGFILFGFIK